MKLPWILAAASLAAAAYVLYVTPGPQSATGFDDIEDAARGTARWGTKARLSGAGDSLAGKLKQGFGKVTGDTDTVDAGLTDQIAGGVKDAAGQLAQAAGQTLHDINR
jgi:uncharacterized protein YjbJ (UPF0337 family)